MNNKVVGRKYQIKLINDYYLSNKNEFVAMYGRRRVGKTYLIKNTLKDNIDFSFTGLYNTKKKEQLSYFRNEFKKRDFDCPELGTWQDAFLYLEKYIKSLKKDKVVIFLDELPWLDDKKGEFLNALSYFWNNWDENTILKLFVCGSATSWMINKIIGDKGGLYGRICRSIYLPPFTINEVKKYFEEVKGYSYSDSELLEIYMIVGGIPYYLDMFDTGLPITKNIDNLFYADKAPLMMEYNFLYRSLYNNADSYKTVIKTLGKKLYGLTREEIIENTNIQGGVLTKILENLENCDFIRSYSPINKKTKDKIYQLIDSYSLYYLTFIDEAKGIDKNYWTKNYNSPKINNWRGYAFEITCLNHIEEIKEALSIGGVSSNIYSWYVKPSKDKNGSLWTGGQIDLIIDRADNCMNLCEIKYSNDEYIISEDYYSHLRERMENFRHFTKTKKNLITTFITTNGVKQNKNKSIVNNEVIFSKIINN